MLIKIKKCIRLIYSINRKIDVYFNGLLKQVIAKIIKPITINNNKLFK